jgi:antitoxin YefM
MKTATVSDFRAKMKERLDEIQEDQDILILSGPKKKDFVVLTLEAYNSMEETAHLLSSSANASRLLESVSQDKSGRARERKIALNPRAGNKLAPVTKAGVSKGRKKRKKVRG